MRRVMARFALLALSLAGLPALADASDGHKLSRLNQECSS